MRRALLSLFIYSVVLVMATAGGGTSGVISAGTERSIDAILQDCCEVANDSDFHNKTNDYRSVFQHSVRCKSSTECRCGVYSLLEVREIQGQLLSKQDAIIEDKPLQIVIRDKDVAAGMTNFRNVMNLAASTPGTKTIAAMFSTNATDNLLCGRRGTIFKTLTAWGTSILKYLHLINELVLYVTRSVQPTMRVLKAENASLKERNLALEIENQTLRARMAELEARLTSHVSSASAIYSSSAAASVTTLHGSLPFQATPRKLIKPKRRLPAKKGTAVAATASACSGGGPSQDLGIVPHRNTQRQRRFAPRTRAPKTESGERCSSI